MVQGTGAKPGTSTGYSNPCTPAPWQQRAALPVRFSQPRSTQRYGSRRTDDEEDALTRPHSPGQAIGQV